MFVFSDTQSLLDISGMDQACPYCSNAKLCLNNTICPGELGVTLLLPELVCVWRSLFIFYNKRAYAYKTDFEKALRI